MRELTSKLGTKPQEKSERKCFRPRHLPLLEEDRNEEGGVFGKHQFVEALKRGADVEEACVVVAVEKGRS